MSLTAAPEFLPRDGSSISTITVKTFDSNGAAKPNQRLYITASAGTLPASEVVTGADGSVTFDYIAPGLNENIERVAISATPIQNTHLQNANPRYVEILVSGPAIPVASFNFSPATPAAVRAGHTRRDHVGPERQAVSLDSARICGRFPDGSTDDERIVQLRFQNQGPQTVTLLVTAPSGTFSSISRTINGWCSGGADGDADLLADEPARRQRSELHCDGHGRSTARPSTATTGTSVAAQASRRRPPGRIRRRLRPHRARRIW